MTPRPTYAIARNMISNGTSNGSPTYSEFTGPAFSPDGAVLFVNIQVPGITLGITAPWERYLRFGGAVARDGPTISL